MTKLLTNSSLIKENITAVSNNTFNWIANEDNGQQMRKLRTQL